MEGDGESRTRRCCRCHQLKPVNEFAWRRKAKAQRDSHCRSCRSEYGKEHYAANRQNYIDAEARRKKARVAQRTELLFEFFRTHPCVDCGENDPLVLEFDHIGEKSFNIAKGIRNRNWQDVLDEIAKCEVVCANCHRRRTSRRGGWVRAVIMSPD